MIRTFRLLHACRTYWIGKRAVSAVARHVAMGIMLLSSGIACAQTPASAPVGTLAGTPIVNTARLNYDLGSDARALDSNTVTLRVAERLDVRLVREGEGPVSVDAGLTIVPFLLTNADNGSEAFAITATLAAQAAPGGIVPVLAFDSDGDGHYDPAHDTALVGGTTPVLAPGATVRLFAVIAPGSVVAADSLVVTARAVSGSGTAGTPFDGKGDGGSDAVVGQTGAVASITVPLRTGNSGPVLIKSQSVANANGASGPATRGSIITYRLEARFPGGAHAAVIADRIPDGTRFVPGSLRVDDAVLTDGSDADPGSFDGRGIAVALGDVAAASSHTVQFNVQIQ